MSRSQSLVSLAALLSLLACSSEAPPPVTAPSTTPTPVPVATTPGCTLPKGIGSGVNCPRTSPTLQGVVEEVVTRVRDKNPGAYPLENPGYRLTAAQLDAFFKDVVDTINAEGRACAFRDGLELAVKNTNNFSEQYKFWVTSGHIRLGDNAYRATCTPAWF